MNRRDSSGFSQQELELIRPDEEELELIRAEQCSLLEFPSRDLREWVVRLAGSVAGFVHQWGNSRFWALITIEPTLTAAYANLEHAVRAVEFAEMVRDVSGICGGVRQ